MTLREKILREQIELWFRELSHANASATIQVKLVGPAHGSDIRASERVRLVQLDVFAEEDEGP